MPTLRANALVIAAAVVIVLVGGGLALFSGGGGGGAPGSRAGSSATPRITPSPSPSSPEPSIPPGSPSPSPLESQTVQLVPASASASGQAPNVQRSNGTVDTYGPERAIDGENATAWCVPGDGTGQYLELSFASPVSVREVAIIPGYDKIDPQTGADRFAENRKITRVRYSFSGGFSVEANFGQNAPLRVRRQPQFTTLPVDVQTSVIRIEPQSTTPPSRSDRDYTCISEAVAFGSGFG